MCTDFCQFQFQFLWCMCLFGSFNFCMYIRTLVSWVYLLWFLWLWFIYMYKLWTLIFMCPISLVYVLHFLLWKLCGTLKLWNPIMYGFNFLRWFFFGVIYYGWLYYNGLQEWNFKIVGSNFIWFQFWSEI
jgi:hypothetical protein